MYILPLNSVNTTNTLVIIKKYGGMLTVNKKEYLQKKCLLKQIYIRQHLSISSKFNFVTFSLNVYVLLLYILHKCICWLYDLHFFKQNNAFNHCRCKDNKSNYIMKHLPNSCSIVLILHVLLLYLTHIYLLFIYSGIYAENKIIYLLRSLNDFCKGTLTRMSGLVTVFG